MYHRTPLSLTGKGVLAERWDKTGSPEYQSKPERRLNITQKAACVLCLRAESTLSTYLCTKIFCATRSIHPAHQPHLVFIWIVYMDMDTMERGMPRNNVYALLACTDRKIIEDNLSCMTNVQTGRLVKHHYTPGRTLPLVMSLSGRHLVVK